MHERPEQNLQVHRCRASSPYHPNASNPCSQAVNDEDRDRMHGEIQRLLQLRPDLPAHIQIQIQRLQRFHNSFAPIHKLPVEILLKIFSLHLRDQYSFPTESPALVFKSLHALAQVSSVWLAIIKESPKFWAWASGSTPEPVWRAALTLSRTQPLAVVVHAYFSRLGDVRSFWKEACLHISRWRSASIIVYKDWDLSLLDGGEASCLKRLQLCVHNRSYNDETKVVERLFQDRAPQLKHLNMTRVTLRSWSSDVLSGLQALELSYIRTNGPSLQQLVDVLHHCPDLEVLSLISVAFAAVQSVANAGNTQISLLSLRKLKLQMVVTPLMEYLFDTMDIPRCTSFYIQGFDDTSSPTFLSSLTMALTPHIEAAIESRLENGVGCTSIVVHEHRQLSLTCQTRRPSDLSTRIFSRLTLSLFDVPCSVVLEWISRIIIQSRREASTFSPSPRVHFEIHTLCYASLEDIFAFLRPTPWIHTLSLHSISFRGYVDIIKALSSPSPISESDSSGGGRDGREWLCPQLKVIKIKHLELAGEGGELVRRMVDARNEAAICGFGDVMPLETVALATAL
ncbi:hypothetical protein FRB98_000271 [Tulasnella sp. 332]|nr:hypothetical protein FRB98_000271 [Tulasnella sp. 332]